MKWDFVLFHHITTLLILAAVFFQVLNKRKNLGRKSIYFIIAIIFTIIPNYYGFANTYFLETKNSTPVFVIFINFITFLFFFLYFYQLSQIRTVKILQGTIIGVFFVGLTISVMITDQFFTKFPVYFYFFECILLLVSITLFFYETFNSNIILNLKEYFPFWVCLSLIIIYIGLLPIILFINNVSSQLSRDTYFVILLFCLSLML